MTVNEKTFFQYKETRALSGYKSAFLVKGSNGKYSLIGATETVPYVFGDKDTYEYDILQSPTKGQVEGKTALESKDIEVLHHRDNVYRFEKLKGKVLDFMCINAEYVGYKFSGTLDYKPNDAEADVNKATVTITPMSAETTPVYDARNEIIETLCFANTIPSTVKKLETVDFSVIQGVSLLTITVNKIEASTNKEEGAITTTDYTITDNSIKFSTTGLRVITVSASNYASWTTTVYVEE